MQESCVRAQAGIVQALSAIRVHSPRALLLLASLVCAVAEWARPLAPDYPDSWDEPDDSFETFVSETVRGQQSTWL